MTGYLIDPPTPYESLETWHKFLASLAELDQDSESVKWAVSYAHEIIAEKEAREQA